MANIGVFWVYNGTVFGKAVSVETGFEGVPGIVDSRDDHVDVWEHERPWLDVSAALASAEYQDVPRGRVLSRQGKPLVYADKTLLNAESKMRIAQFFEFNPDAAIWKSDMHYTTSRTELDELFSDDLA
jgi:hypothetical protein